MVVELTDELDRELDDTELDRELEVDELDELDLELEIKLDDDCDELDLELEILDVELEFDELEDDFELDCVLDDLLLVELVDELDFDVDWLDDSDELIGLFSELEVTTIATEDCELLLEELIWLLIEEELTTRFWLEAELETVANEDDVSLFAIWLELPGLELFNSDLDELLFPPASPPPPPQAANARESIKQVAILYPIIIKSLLLIMIWNFTSNRRFSMRRISHW